MAWRTKEEAREKFALEAIRHLDDLYRVAFHLVKGPNEVQDLVQETYTRALGRYEQFVPGTNLKAWLAKILHNLFLDDYREAKRWVSTEDKTGEKLGESNYWEKLPTEDSGPQDDILREELSVKITEALKRLPEEFRQPIVLVDMSDFSYAEAAEILSCPLGTVRSRLSRGRELMHRYLKDYVGVKEKV